MDNYSYEYWCNKYRDAGIITIPITYNQKAKPPLGWRSETSEQMWSQAKKPSNLAIRVGDNGLFLLDPDSDEAVETVENYLHGLGIIPFQVRTPSGRRHSYVRTIFPEEYHKNGKLLVGKGDWRAANGYGLSAPSVVDGKPYELLSDPAMIPFVEATDLMDLIKVRVLGQHAKNAEAADGEAYKHPDPVIPIPLLRRDVPRKVFSLAETLARAEKGKLVYEENWGKTWQSRSEALFSGYLSLVMNGYVFDEAIAIMQIPDRSRGWHYRAYLDAVECAIQTGARPQLAEMHNARWVFPGRTGSTDLLVFRALLALAWVSASPIAYYTTRDVELLTTVSTKTIAKSVARLSNDYGLIKDIPNGRVNSGFEVLLDSPAIDRFLISTTKDTVVGGVSYNTPTVSFVGVMRKTPSQELFRRGSIRKSALPILETLSETPITAAEIIAQSGRASATVYRQLKKLSSQGVVEKQDGGWVLGQRQLADLEDEYGCEASAKRRKDGIDLQRRMLKYQGWRVVNGQDP